MQLFTPLDFVQLMFYYLYKLKIQNLSFQEGKNG